MRQIQVKEFQVLPGDFRENTLKLRKLLDECRVCKEETEILFEEGVYHFYPDYAEEKLLYISNHDEDTIKKIAFDLTGCRNLTLRGNKTEFRFHTDILPFYIHSCENVTVEATVSGKDTQLFCQTYFFENSSVVFLSSIVVELNRIIVSESV